jgi:hypothetical protein
VETGFDQQCMGEGIRKKDKPKSPTWFFPGRQIADLVKDVDWQPGNPAVKKSLPVFARTNYQKFSLDCKGLHSEAIVPVCAHRSGRS